MRKVLFCVMGLVPTLVKASNDQALTMGKVLRETTASSVAEVQKGFVTAVGSLLTKLDEQKEEIEKSSRMKEKWKEARTALTEVKEFLQEHGVDDQGNFTDEQAQRFGKLHEKIIALTKNGFFDICRMMILLDGLDGGMTALLDDIWRCLLQGRELMDYVAYLSEKDGDEVENGEICYNVGSLLINMAARCKAMGQFDGSVPSQLKRVGEKIWEISVYLGNEDAVWEADNSVWTITRRVNSCLSHEDDKLKGILDYIR